MQLEAAEREIEDGDAGDLGGNVGAAGKVFGGAVPDDIAPVQADAHSELVVLAKEGRSGQTQQEQHSLVLRCTHLNGDANVGQIVDGKGVLEQHGAVDDERHGGVQVLGVHHERGAHRVVNVDLACTSTKQGPKK